MPRQSPSTTALKANRLRCESLENPLGLDEPRPRLSWILQADRRGDRQTAYHIAVATSPELLRADSPDLWDSGRVASDRTSRIEYEGTPLGSRTRAYWRVKVWDHADRSAPWSDIAFWETGLLEPDDWQAEWIGLPDCSEPDPLDLEGCFWVWHPGENAALNANPADLFFRGAVEIDARRTVRRARFLLTADDEFTLYANGKQASSDDITTRDWRELNEIDLTRTLRPGANVIAIRAANRTAGPAGLIGRLRVDFTSGDPLSIDIDARWKTAGDTAEGWAEPGFDDGSWCEAYEHTRFGEGHWGRPGTARVPMQPCPHLRKEFTIEEPVRRASLSATALGVYELRLNGERVGDAVLPPGWTDYDKRIQVQTWDVTRRLRPGPNAFAAILGDGWYAGNIGHVGRYQYGSCPLRFLLQLSVEYENGARTEISSNGSWRASTGPILASDLQAGETYDARLERPGWDQPGFDDAAWQPADAVDLADAPVRGRLVAQRSPTVQVTRTLRPEAITQPNPGVYIIDLGQNMVGRCRLRVRGPAGAEVTLRHGEMLYPDGTLYTENLRGVAATDRYILRGEGEEIFEPRFTFHGFRYVELTGYPGEPDLESVTGCVVHSAMAQCGTFDCSDPMLNRLQRNLNWSLRGNFLSVPTDCPQRNERMGWTGDAEVFAPTACFNRNTSAFFTKWMQDVADAQGPAGEFRDVAPQVRGMGGGNNAWGDAGVIIPWTLYKFYGDTRVIERHYDAMTRWIDYLRANSRDLIRPEGGYGDWLAVGADTPTDLINTAYFALSASRMAEMAAAIGRNDDAAGFAALFEDVRKAFNRAYVDKAGRVRGDTQCGYALALNFGLLDADTREKALSHLRDNIRRNGGRLTTGFVGTASLLPALVRNGALDEFYDILLQRAFPSWGYMIDQDATTMWERWNSWSDETGWGDAAMNSFNHYAFGAVGEWLFRAVAGLDTAPDDVGFRRLVIRPRPGGGLTRSAAVYDSVSGRIVSCWELRGGRLVVDVVVPPGATADVYVPAAAPNQVTVGETLGAQPPGVSLSSMVDGAAVFQVASGSYHFETPAPPHTAGAG